MPARPLTIRRRSWLPAALAVTVGLGLVTTVVPGHHAVTGAVGDALYAVMVWLIVALIAPRARSTTVTAVALAVCWAVELAQATGVPAQIVGAVPPARLLLGTTFAATDSLAYAAGCAAALAADAIMRRGRTAEHLASRGTSRR